MNTNTVTSAVGFARPQFPFGRCTYLAVRPTFECGDRTASAMLDDYEEVQLQVGLPDHPTHCLEIYDDLADTINLALSIKADHPHLRLFYNGEEVQAPFDCWRSLALVFAESYDAWEVVEQVATGALKADDERVQDCISDCPLIGTAIGKVVA
ncbi:MAG TPA: hypothetical protein VGU45_11855 [Microvirga sp.]|jgi:hypothetical protein|nr:hypothetical protein [Microvirga sp.]